MIIYNLLFDHSMIFQFIHKFLILINIDIDIDYITLVIIQLIIFPSIIFYNTFYFTSFVNLLIIYFWYFIFSQYFHNIFHNIFFRDSKRALSSFLQINKIVFRIRSNQRTGKKKIINDYYLKLLLLRLMKSLSIIDMIFVIVK